MTKRINTSPTPDLYEAVKRYANENSISESRAMTELAAIGVKSVYDKPVEATAPHGDPTRILRIGKDMKVWQCMSCIETFYAKNPMECPRCGSDEFNQVVSE